MVSTPSLFSPTHRRSTIALAALPFLVAFEALAVSTVMPRAAEELGGVSLYPLVFAAPLATSLVSIVVAGAWNDRQGPMRVMTVGLVVFCAALFVVGLAPSMAVLVAGRALQGLGMGFVTVSLYVLIARLYPPSLQPRMFTVLSAAWVVPGLVGPALAGWVTEVAGWRIVFLAVPFLVLPARLLLQDPTGAASVPGEEAADGDLVPTGSPTGSASGTASRTTRPPLIAACAAALGVAALSVIGEQAEGSLSGATVPLLLVALVLVALTVPRLLPRRVLFSPDRVGRLVMARGVLAASFVLAEVYLPLQLVARYGMSPAHAGLILTVSTVTWFVGAWMAGSEMLPERARIPAGAAAMAVGTLATAALLLGGHSPWLAGLTWCLTGLGMGLAFTSTSILTMRRSHPARQGRNSAALQVAEALTQSVMLALTGVAFQVLLQDRGETSPAPYAAMFASATALAVVGVVVGVATRRKAGGRSRPGLPR
nr:MFS transporter [Brachybacterium muris]